MQKLPSYNLSEWPFKDYDYISDLIEYEGPILVHYRKGNYNALYYWVEGNKTHNRWLCFNVSLFDLHRYLHKDISLFELIAAKDNDYFFVTDIDEKLVYGNFQMINGFALPDEYYPDEDSYFINELPDYFEKLFVQMGNHDNYVEFMKLREVSMEIKPHVNSPHGDVVSMTDSIDFLDGINNSYKHFVAYKFYQDYKDRYSDAKQLLRATKKIVEASELRITGAERHSFQISFATDRIIEMDSVREYNDFSEKIIDKYQEEVLNLDLNDEKVAASLLEKYDDETRGKIFQPLIRVINNTNCNLSLIDKKKNKRRPFTKVNPIIKSKILQKTPKPSAPEELQKVFYTITLELSANTDLTSISKKDLQEATLFTKVSRAAQQEIQKFDFDTFTVIFKKPIELTYLTNDDGSFTIEFSPLNISVTARNRNNASERVVDEFENLIRQDYMSTTPKNKSNKTFFEQNIVDLILKES